MRKAAATRAAENGATERELEAIFGWSGGRMATLYTKSANRSRLAAGAIGKLDRAEKRWEEFKSTNSAKLYSWICGDPKSDPLTRDLHV